MGIKSQAYRPLAIRSATAVLLATAAVLGNLVASSPQSAAASVASPCVRKGAAAGRVATAEALDQFSATMYEQGYTAAAVEKALESDWCLTRVSSSRGSTPLSAETDIYWTHSAIFYDDDDRRYHATVAFRWYNHNYWDDEGWPTGCFNSGIGGRDGLGLRLSGGEYAIYGYSASVWGDPYLNPYNDDYGTVTLSSASSVNQYGVGFTWQDNTRNVRSGVVCQGGKDYADYDIYGGQVFLTVRALNGSCRLAQVFGDYVHTWDSTAVTGIGAGPWSFSISWSNYGSNFESAYAGDRVTIC